MIMILFTASLFLEKDIVSKKLYQHGENLSTKFEPIILLIQLSTRFQAEDTQKMIHDIKTYLLKSFGSKLTSNINSHILI